MPLNPKQYLGGKCVSPPTNYYDCIYGSGVFNTSYGSWIFSGVAIGEGRFEGVGFFGMFGTDCSGYASGYISDNPLDFIGNGLPYITYSGNGFVSGSDIVNTYQPGGEFNGRNFFQASTDIFRPYIWLSGQTVPTSVSGDGNFWVSGVFYMPYGALSSFTGTIIGTGYLDGSGVKWNPCASVIHAPICSGNFRRFMAVGDFAASGIISGSGLYSMTPTFVYDYRTFNDPFGLGFGSLNVPQRIWGSGEYFTVEGGDFSGVCDGIFWGYGVVTGHHVTYPSGLASYLPQEFWGSGDFRASNAGGSWMRGSNGWFQTNNGTAKGKGNFRYVGFGSGLLMNPNVISGSGIVAGVGTIYYIDPSGNPTGVYCVSSYPTSPVHSGCGKFPPLMQNCQSVGNIGIDFNAGGFCVIQGDPT